MNVVDIVYTVVFCLIMVSIGYIDYKKKIIPNKIVFPAIIAAIIFNFFTSLGWQSCLLGGLVGVGFILLTWVFGYISSKDPGNALGGGDTKLFPLIGLISGFPASLAVLAACTIISGFYGMMKTIYMYKPANIKRLRSLASKASVEAGPPYAMITIGWLLSWLFIFLPAVS